MRLYCNRYGHFKDPLVCSVVCPYRTRCSDFALYYDANREAVDSLVANYYESRNETPQNPRTPAAMTLAVPVEMRALIRLEVKKVMADAVYIWIGKEDTAELVEHEEVIRRAERGSKPKAIYKVSQEMELKFQLVPRKRIEKVKRTVAADAERAAARRKAPRPVQIDPPTPLKPVAVSEAPNSSSTRRGRGRAAKVVGER
jgi:hypothetical protein